jgi:hypothetical protein
LQTFARFGPNGLPMDVQQCLMDGGGRLVKTNLQHRIFLSGIVADTPANRKLSKFMGHTAILACPYCWLGGTTGPSGRGKYYLGYSCPTHILCPEHLKKEFPHLFGDVPTSAFCGDARIKLDEIKNLTRIQELENLKAKATSKTAVENLQTIFGVQCLSPIIAHLGDYVNINDIWQVPLAHAALLGVVKQFFKATMDYTGEAPDYAFSRPALKIIESRAKHVILTDDFNRPYRDIADKKGHYVMEDWLHFMESYSLYILSTDGAPDLWPDVEMKEAWDHLRTGLMHYFRYNEDDFTIEKRALARSHLIDFAKIWQRRIGITGCTFNLHTLICRLFDQETARGALTFTLEWWLEQGIQQMKSNVKFRCVVCMKALTHG